MARIDTDLAEVLQAVVSRLIDQIDGFTPATCFLALHPEDVPHSKIGDIFCAVFPAQGTFDEGMFDGGGENQVCSNTEFVVKIYSALQTDEDGHATEFLTNATLGVIAKMKQVLLALAGHDLTNEDGDTFLRDLPCPGKYAFERADKKAGSVELTFKISFDWDLSE